MALKSDVRKPNIRRLYHVPRGWIRCDADLKGADAQVVAWESDEDDFKRQLRSGVKLHKITATEFFGQRFLDAPGDTGNKLTPKGRMYDDIKRATHGTNYGASGKTVATNLGWSLGEGVRFHDWWLHTKHPGIGRWHSRTERQLRTDGRVANAFGYDVTYFGRVDGLLPEALAWIPQSTVALVSFKSALALRKRFKFIKFRLQVHDSIVFDIPLTEKSALVDIRDTLSVTVPYPDPLIIGSKLSISTRSWGDMVEFVGDTWPEGA